MKAQEPRTMKAQELRIGNSIKVNGDIVPDIGYGAIMDMYKKQKGIKNDYFNSLVFEPIPLTEEWLMKFGFGKIGMAYVKYSFVIEKKADRELVYGYMGWDIQIHHVHQLQNLYFALTGKELNQTK